MKGRHRRRPSPARLIVRLVLAGVVIAVLVLFVFPTRSYLNQRHQLATTAERVRILADQNAQLSAQVDKLHTDAEIERIAREQYHLVRPGEQAFAILPAPAAAPAGLAPPAPLPAPHVAHRSLIGSVWHDLTSWL